MNLNSARSQNLDRSQSQNSNRSQSLDPQGVKHDLEIETACIRCVSFWGTHFVFCCRRGFARCLEQPEVRWNLECFGKMVLVKP